MKISTKGRYGARASLELALRFGSGPTMVREIAEKQDISERYLEQILNTLRTSELVKSTRGAKGGYELARAPETITVAEIVRALEGPFDIVPCAYECNNGKRDECVTCTVWAEVKDAIEGVLTNITLADLVKRREEYINKIGNIEYNI
mgnify:CR=1 FL=1